MTDTHDVCCLYCGQAPACVFGFCQRCADDAFTIPDPH